MYIWHFSLMESWRTLGEGSARLRIAVTFEVFFGSLVEAKQRGVTVKYVKHTYHQIYNEKQ
jgi:hypothetical protein